MARRIRPLIAALSVLMMLLAAGCNNLLPPWLAHRTGPADVVDYTAPAGPVRVSGPSPYAACTLGGQGTRYKNGDVETWLAVNPKALKEGRIEYIGVWMTDRWSNGGGSGLVAASSFDAGKSWTQTPLAFGGCGENGLRPWARVSDPWVSIGPDGTAYASGLIIDNQRGSWVIAAAASRDGGRTWGDYKAVAEEKSYGRIGLDKEAVTADPTRPGTAYLVWNRNDNTNKPVQSTVQLSITTDGGKSWSKPQVLFTAPRGDVPLGNVIEVDPRDGTLYNLFRWLTPTAPGANTYNARNALQRSTDGGKTWTEPKAIIDVSEDEVVPPDKSAPVRTGGAPLYTVDGRTGRLYLVWGDNRFDAAKSPAIALAWSDDRGETWSEPVRVNPAESRGAFRGSVAVNARGQVGVSYYDFRETTEKGEGLPTHHWLAVYTPGPDGLGKPVETHIAGPFDLAKAPMAPGPFLGDYIGLTAVGDAFTLFYVATTPEAENPTDVYAVTIRP